MRRGTFPEAKEGEKVGQAGGRVLTACIISANVVPRHTSRGASRPSLAAAWRCPVARYRGKCLCKYDERAGIRQRETRGIEKKKKKKICSRLL